MDRIPAEVIFRHAFRTAAEYFAEKLEKRRREGFVPILIEDFYESVYFAECNHHGYPKRPYIEAMEITAPKIGIYSVNAAIDDTIDMTAWRTTIQIEKPILTQRYDFNDYPYVFMWSGKKLGTQKVPTSELNVSELMRVAQAAIKNREGLIIDEALKNKIYK